MDEFETINLDIKECKICKQQTGEELISCILHESFASSTENTSRVSSSNGVETFAHRICLERWDAVMKSSFYPQPKKTWKDRIMSLVTTGQASFETWNPVVYLDHANRSADNRPSCSDEQRNKVPKASQNVGHSVFHDSKEAYRVEDVGNDHGQWRKSKVRICSVDLEEESEGEESTAVLATTERNSTRHTRSTCKYLFSVI